MLKKSESTVYLKDFLIPLFTAVFVIATNQLLVFNTKNTEAKVEFELNRLKEQTPILNRLLWFGLVNSRKVNEYVEVQEIEIHISEKDTTYINRPRKITVDKNPLPPFLIDSIGRAKTLEDVEFFEENINLIDHRLRMRLELVLGSIDFENLPHNFERDTIKRTKWQNPAALDDFYLKVDNLYNLAYEILYRDEFNGQYPDMRAGFRMVEKTIDESGILKSKEN